MRSRLLSILRTQPIALVALFLALGGTSFAAVGTVSRLSGANGNVVVGCVGDNTGRLRVVSGPSRCGTQETAISFNRTGKAGRDGADGADGATGKAGPTGREGASGAAGPKGATGDTGNTGAASTVAGPKGDPGAASTVAGPQGATGPAGAASTVAGPQGATGPAGAASTVAGPQGATGAKGDTGDTGASGATETAASLLTKLQTVDGAASALDADLLDGHSSTDFVLASAFDTNYATAYDLLFDSSAGHTALAPQDTSSNTSGGIDVYMGSVYLMATDFPPPGTAFASGQLLPISQYSALFALLGTQYGGNGTTNFALPDLRKQAPGGLRYVITTMGIFPSRQ